MKLADFVKGLKVGELVYVEQKEAASSRAMQLWRTKEGKYNFIFEGDDFSNEFETADDVLFSKEFFETADDVFFRKAFETAGELLDYIAKHFADWLACDYEVYKSREELKREIKQLEKALKSACKIIEGGEICLECPATNSCLENSDITCAENIYNALMKEAAK
jgi:hypothetical protein